MVIGFKPVLNLGLGPVLEVKLNKIWLGPASCCYPLEIWNLYANVAKSQFLNIWLLFLLLHGRNSKLSKCYDLQCSAIVFCLCSTRVASCICVSPQPGMDLWPLVRCSYHWAVSWFSMYVFFIFFILTLIKINSLDSLRCPSSLEIPTDL